MSKITIRERFTRTSWEVQVGDGPWRPVDLTLYGGKPPVILAPDVEWVIVSREEEDKT